MGWSHNPGGDRDIMSVEKTIHPDSPPAMSFHGSVDSVTVSSSARSGSAQKQTDKHILVQGTSAHTTQNEVALYPQYPGAPNCA